MNTEQIRELENKWLVMMAARNAKTDQLVSSYDLKYRRECEAVAVQIAEAKMAAAPAPVQINEANLAYMNRIQAAPAYADPNSGLRTAHLKALAHVIEGTTVPADVVAVLHATGVK